jgi:hypothetical protein
VTPLSVIEIHAFVAGYGVIPHLVATVRPVEGSPGDIVACVAYVTAPGERRLWGVVQRVGPVWSATLGLDPRTAASRATAIARREDARDPLPPGGPDA